MSDTFMRDDATPLRKGERAKARQYERRVERALVGRTITRVQLRHWEDGNGSLNSNPIITLDNGTTIEFATEECASGDEYGTYPIVTKKPRGSRRTP